MKRLAIVLATLFLSLVPLDLRAQFYGSGEDPARLRWMQSEWPHFRVVYPEGLDSLANVYGNLLEKYRVPVSRSTGMESGTGYRRKTPVVLHAYNGVSNAMVAWAPKRMEFYTLGMPYETEALPWEKNLAIHEGRHLSQMMLGYMGRFRPMRWFTGDILPIAATGLWSPSYLLEGDAVVAETALTDLGRGRDGDFLNYYRSAFDRGDIRSWNAWKYGSWRHYAPDHYALGYMTIAGTRVFYNDPLFMDNIYSRLYGRRGLRFYETGINSVRREIRQASGMKFRDAWDGITEGFRSIWDEDAALRGPFIRDEYVTDIPSWYESYAHGTFAQGSYLAVRSGLLRPSTLVRVESDGSVTELRPFGGSVSKLSYDPELERLYWSETFTNPRWDHGAVSRIRYIDLPSQDQSLASGRRAHVSGIRVRGSRAYRPKDLTKSGRLYNPVPSPDGKSIAAVDYRYEGGTDLVVLDACSGEISSRWMAPSGMQLTLPVWYGDGLVVVGLSDEGMGIYRLSGGDFIPLVPAAKTKIGGLGNHEDGLVFTSDRTGVNETYVYRDGEVFQVTATRYGAIDGLFEGDTLYFLAQEARIPLAAKAGKKQRYGEGTLLHKAAVSDLIDRKVDFQKVSGDKVADILTLQEQALAGGTMDLDSWAMDSGSSWNDITPQSKRYNKLAHIPRFHSWVPLNMQYDDFAALNFDEMLSSCGLGATAWYQNDLGTASGYVSYGYRLSPVKREGAWNNHHSGHFKILYTGLYPAFELEANIGDRPAMLYHREWDSYGEEFSMARVKGSYAAYPEFNTSLRVYVPLKFNSGGWLRGLTPSVSYSFSNSVYDKSVLLFDHEGSLVQTSPDYVPGMPWPQDHREFAGISKGDKVFMQTFNASVSGYVMQPAPASAVFPRLGIGVQAGYHQRLGLSDLYSAGLFGYVYGYLPGIIRSQGLKLTALYQHTFDAFFVENSVNLLPRGFQQSTLDLALGSISGSQIKLTADYAIQVGLPQRQPLSGLFHLSHMSLIPHGDVLAFPYLGEMTDMVRPSLLYSVGADVTFHMRNLLWFPLDGQIGVTLNYNGGPSMDRLIADGCDLPRTYVGMVFSLDI